MKKQVFIIGLLVTMLLCACTQTPAATSTMPPETTLPVETTTVPETTDNVITDFSDYYTLLESDLPERNWLYHAMGCTFTRPEEVDLYYMFYLGIDAGSWNDLSEESQQSLVEQGLMMEFDLQLMPAQTLDAIVQSTFGIPLSDMTIPEDWGYAEAEDTYCSNHSDAYIPGNFTITAVTDSGDTIQIWYTIDDYYYDTTTEEFLINPSLLLTLHRQADGSINAVSNVVV